MENVPGAYYHSDEFLCMPDSPPNIMKWCTQEFQFRNDDVLIVSYPQQGIFWLQEVLWNIQNPECINIYDVKPTALGYRVPMLEHEHFGEQPWDLINKLDDTKPRLVKTHMPRNYLDRHIEEGKVKMIVWIMDPRCALVKFNTFWNMSAKFYKWPSFEWNEFYEMFKNKKLMEGDWFNTTKSFLPIKDNTNILFLKYEDAKENPLETLRKIEEFTGNRISVEQETELLEKLTFDKAADWRAKFTREQRIDFNEIYREKMKGTPYADCYIDNEVYQME